MIFSSSDKNYCWKNYLWMDHFHQFMHERLKTPHEIPDVKSEVMSSQCVAAVTDSTVEVV